LVTDGGIGQARSTLAVVRALAQGGYLPAVTYSNRFSLAAASQYCGRRIPVPLLEENGQGYTKAVAAELDRGDYLTVLATSDRALLALGAPVRHLIDKALLIDSAARAQIPVPPTIPFSSPSALRAAASRLPYPAVVKPQMSSLRPLKVGSPAELANAQIPDVSVVVQPHIDQPLWGMAGVVWEGRMVAAVNYRCLRTIVDFGMTCAAQTTTPNEQMEPKLLDLMHGYQGIFQAQFAGPFLLDINPRPYGSLPLAVKAGANLPAIYCDLLQGESIDGPIVARPGVWYRWIEGDLRHVASRLRRGKMGPLKALHTLHPHRGAAHSTESWTDLKPLLARVGYVVRKGAYANRRKVGSVTG
jgi:hypothetical protein